MENTSRTEQDYFYTQTIVVGILHTCCVCVVNISMSFSASVLRPLRKSMGKKMDKFLTRTTRTEQETDAQQAWKMKNLGIS
jgi:hypothetical protein